jgi:Rod binding domain-containing protein
MEDSYMHTIAVLPATPGATDAAVPQPRLVRAAHEFEAQMMKELMKPMTERSSLTGDEADSASESGSGGALTEFASEALGRALSERGGFGIANSIVKDLSRSGTRTRTAPVTGNLHSDTVMKSHE